jgi:hypothetical protein
MMLVLLASMTLANDFMHKLYREKPARKGRAMCTSSAG